MNADRPTGVVTLLFTDIEGSTRLLRSLTADDAVTAFALHGRVLREAISRHGGYEQRTEGDSFFAVFQQATPAVAAAVEAQRLLAAQAWPGGLPVRVRMGLHTCEPIQADGDYLGLDVHRAARIASAGHGGQVLLSEATRTVAELPDGVTVRDLGEHRLKDLDQPERIHQLRIEGLDSDFPPLNSLETPSNLPSAVTRLVGRDADLAAVEQLVRRDDVRMVTITGTGGTGKTRVAIAVAGRLGDAFRDGLVFVDLTAVTDAAQVATAVEAALDVPSTPGVPPVENLVNHLRYRAVLLVLDNFEHLTPAAGDLATLLAGAARLKAVVTSRVPLRISAEHEYPLQLLAPRDAVELFVERARATQPAFEVSAAEAQVVGKICARLDHLPLALELAAARTKFLTVEQVLAHLDSRLGLLSSGPRDVPARQQTLRATIAWSYDLLPPGAAALLRRAAVFVGGFTVDALVTVADDPEALAGIEVLLDHSLVRRDSGTGRLSLLETIREFALEQGQLTGELDETRRRHADFYAALASRIEEGRHGPDRVAWRDRLEDELANLLTALEWALEAEPPAAEPAAAIAVPLGMHWYTHGRPAEGAAWLWRVRALPDIPTRLRAQLAQRLGVLLDQQADKAGAAVVLAESVELFRQVADRTGLGRALNSLASASREVGSTARARELYEEALQIRTEIGDEEGISVTTFNLAQVAMDDGDFSTARRLFEESHEIDQGLGEDWGAAIGSLGIATAAIAQGDLAAAAPRLRSAVLFFVDADDEDHLAETLVVCADEARALGLAERSARLLGASDEMRSRIGIPLAPADEVHVERCRRAVEATLGAEAYAAATARGRAMTAAQAVTFALESPSSDGPAAARSGAS
ncbi:ATP-binding protein [Nocardioides taihuensis]|uniref:ATP-binding protein n=1 Tax=Nocardioides taihuensis TaxID=1835606 RepID=A0ABW0BHQ7_9ACTN